MNKLLFTTLAIAALLLCSHNQDKFVQQHGESTIAQVMAQNEANGEYHGFPGAR